MRTLSAR